MCIAIGGILAVLSFNFTCVSVLYWLFFILVLYVYRCYIGCPSFIFYMCIGAMLGVLPLVLHVYMCNISCSCFYLYMCIGVILAVLSFSLTCV